MKTKTILDAYLKISDPNYIHWSYMRKHYVFETALLRRIEEGDRAREALQMAGRAYYSGDDEMLGYILKGVR